MDFFKRLGDQVEREWRASSYDEDRFADIAARALAEQSPSEHVGPYDTLKWILRPHAIQPQIHLPDPFGQPPVQVYTTERFHIEVLHWMDGTTAVHQHAFTGAFHVLAGSSVHSLYRFEESRRYGVRLRLGRVQLEKVELLERAATRPIVAGSSMIHSLFHLDRPSVTVVIRADVPGTDPQYSYLKPRIAFDPFFTPEPVQRQIQAIGALAGLKHPDFESILLETYRDADPFTFVLLVMGTLSYLKSDVLVRRALQRSREFHGELADALIEVAAEMLRQRVIVNLRAKLRSPEHRFFLALLLLFSNGKEILSLIKTRYPEAAGDPSDIAIRWMREVTELADPDDPARKVFGVMLDESMPDVMKPMLGGRSLDDIVEALKRDFDESDVAGQLTVLARTQEALRSSLFGPLFR